MNVEDLVVCVSSLSAAELARFSQWFEGFVADRWDHQIEQDTPVGRLDAALQRADDYRQAGCVALL